MNTCKPEQGYSLLELLFVIGILASIAGIGVPQLVSAMDDHRTAGAAHYLSTRIQRARIEAVTRSTSVALQFVDGAAGYSFGVFADGNGDGVRTQDIIDAIDVQLHTAERLADTFDGVDLGLLPGLPANEAGGAVPGTDPVKLGASNLLSYSPHGTCTSGSLYLRGRGQTQYVVRIFGDTGRTRVLKFNPRSRQWLPA
jgi:prepilin-type N-terminal cleavage/methylation domain-containing protein